MENDRDLARKIGCVLPIYIVLACIHDMGGDKDGKICTDERYFSIYKKKKKKLLPVYLETKIFFFFFFCLLINMLYREE